MKRKLVKWSTNAILVLGSILLALFICEFIVRYLYKDKINLFPRYATNGVYGEYSIRRLRSNMEFKHISIDGVFHFKTNNKGFRSDEDIDYQKKNDEIRILCLGDSHTQGFEVDQHETYSWVAESLLREKGINATVINTGVAGFSTAEELIFLENEGYKYHPDFVVLGFSETDITDNIKTSIFCLQNDSLKLLKNKHLPGINIQNYIYKYRIIHFLGENSYLYTFLFDHIWRFYQKKSIKKNKIIQTEYATSEKQYYSQYEFNLTGRIIERLYNFTLKRNIPLIIIDIPSLNLKPKPEQLVNYFINNSDTLFNSQNMLQEYNKISEIHVAHGQRHISKETHSLLGGMLANYIYNNIELIHTNN
jgi:lysophospholipase L1-like esterase